MIRRVRLFTGLVLLAYVSTHLINHALGLISLDAMEAGRTWFLGLWRNPVGTVLMLGSLATHLALAAWALYRRRGLRMPIGEAAQLALGFAVPLLLLGHIIGTRGAHEIAGTNDTYVYVLLAHWRFDTSYIYQQTAGLLAAWIHGCIGVHYWLRLKPVYPQLVPALYGAALVVPLLALLGYAQTGRQVADLARDASWMRAATAGIKWPSGGEVAILNDMLSGAQGAVVGLIVLALAGQVVRAVLERRRGVIRVSYPTGRVVTAPPGSSILDASRAAGIPHASVCGARGRCSTCRVRITAGGEALPEPSAEERRVLDRVGAPAHVRLACQTRPEGDVAIVPLLPPDATTRDAHPRSSLHQGQEREIAVLFADLRGFTQFSENKLPYDVVFVLNRYFASMGEAVETAGGRLDKFVGDGVMALFGIDTDPQEGCRRSLVAARAMAARLDELNRAIAADLDQPMRMGIGIHVGPAIVGEMGYGTAIGLTAVGDTVNTASRLEAMTKEFGAQLVVSEDVADRAGVDLSASPRHEVEVRGRHEPIAVRVIGRAEAMTSDALRAG